MGLPKMPPLSLAIAVLIVPGCAAAEFGDDFANNLFTDLAPLIALFGERVTMQFLSQATGWADGFTLAMAPLGIITIIISAIRVGGPSWLKAIIGRARENLAAAEVELMPSTSVDVCELWNGSEIVRSLGSPPVREFICLVPQERRGSRSGLESEPNIECRTIHEALKEGYLITSHRNTDFESAKSLKATRPQTSETATPTLDVIVACNTSSSAPNISLNVHLQKREEVRTAAVIGTILQLGVLVYAGFATYYYTMRFPKEGDELVAEYAFPCTASGTVLLVTGLLLCVDVVEKRTEEVTQKTIEGYEAYTIWVQKQATVGDQVFRSFGIFSNMPKTKITTSRRHDSVQGPRDLSIIDTIVKVMSYIPLELAHGLENLFGRSKLSKKGDDSVRSSKTVLGTILSLSGYVIQFVGLRGMHWSVSIVQLAAVATMTAARAFVRRQLAVPPQAQPLSQEFELEWLASTMADRDDGPWGTTPSDSSTFGKHWLILTGGNDKFDAKYDRENNPSQEGKEEGEDLSEDLGSTDGDSNIEISSNADSGTEHIASIDIADEHGGQVPGSQESCDDLAGLEHLQLSKAQIVVSLRSKLGELTGWRSPVAIEACSLVRAIEVVMNTLFAHSPQESFEWPLRAIYNDSDPEHVQISLYQENGNWKVNQHDVEAVLSLWICSAREHQRLSPLGDDSPVSRNTPNVRLLGPDTTALRRDLQWWMPRGLKKTFVVSESLKGSLVAEKPRVVGAGRSDVSLSGHNRVVMFERTELDETQHAPPLETTDLDEGNDNPPFGQIITNGFLAAESFTPLASLYALDLFTSFMWTVAKAMTRPIAGQADARPNDINGIRSWIYFSLHNSNLSKMAGEIHNTGIGSLGEVYLSIIPPLSKVCRLPSVDIIVDLAREHGMPYEKRGDMENVTIDYVWLLRTAYTFPRSDIITLKAMAVMLEHLGQLYQEDDLSGLIQGSDLIPRLQIWIENELDLEDLDTQRLFSQVMRMYFDQRREKRFPDRLKKLAESNPIFQKMARLFSSRAKRTRYEACDKGDITGWTQLHWDAAAGEKTQVKTLLKLDANIHAQDLLGQTPLHYTCQAERLDIAALLIQNAADVNAPARNGWTPLHCAAIYGHQAMIELLVESGANPDAIDSSRKTPTMWTAFRGHRKALTYLQNDANLKLRDDRGRTILHLAVMSGTTGMIGVLRGTTTETQDRDGRTPLHLAALYGNEDAFSVLTSELGADITAKDNASRSLLHLASIGGNEEIMTKLVMDFKMDINCRDDENETPLHCAVRVGKVVSVETLARHAADLEARDRRWRTPLFVACMEGQDEIVKALTKLGADTEAKDDFDSTPLNQAAWYGHEAVVRQLISGQLDKETKSDAGWGPLHGAAMHGYEGVARALVEAGADKETKDEDGMTPLHHAAEQGYEDIVGLLARNGADVDCKDNKGMTPLHYAAEETYTRFVRRTGYRQRFVADVANPGREKVVQILLGAGAKRDIRNIEGHTALDLAVKAGKETVAAMLQTPSPT